MSSITDKVKKLPQTPGVYFFYGQDKELLYIGKATNLRSRVGSYLRGQHNRGEWIDRMISFIADIAFQETDSVLEALILESNLIKKHQPKYNTLEKDDKSFAYFVITKEEFPRVLIVRKTDLDKMPKLKSELSKKEAETKTKRFKYKDVRVANSFGPYSSKMQMEIALKIMRRIFPFHAHKQKSEKGCLDFQMGVCPGPYANAISLESYKKNIRGIRMILEGKKKSLIRTLEKEMQDSAKKHEFEKAADIRNKIYALNHIRDVALMTRDFDSLQLPLFGHQSSENLEAKSHKSIRIEAYDISNISGEHAVASMVVFGNKHPDKSQYRKFKIKTIEGSNDIGMMREVLMRRFNNDWPMPDLILLDGGQGHANMASDLIMELGLDLLVVAVAKGATRKNLNFQFPASNKLLISEFPKELCDFLDDKNAVKAIMDEAHRFAITFHRHRRKKGMLD